MLQAERHSPAFTTGEELTSGTKTNIFAVEDIVGIVKGNHKIVQEMIHQVGVQTAADITTKPSWAARIDWMLDAIRRRGGRR